jgi:hypothetical protein
MSEQTETLFGRGPITDAYEAMAMNQLKRRVAGVVKKLTNGASRECTPEAHAVVCEGTALSLEMHLAVLNILKVRSRAASIWATVGSVAGGVIVVVALKFLESHGVKLAGG